MQDSDENGRHVNYLISRQVSAYVGLGSNLKNPVRQVTEALEELDAIALTRRQKRSSLYRSQPMGPVDQPDYINAVAELVTALTAEQLLAELQRIERRHGRSRGPKRWGPRTLDLDLLLYGQERIMTDTLAVPHPGLSDRDFVLYPLYEIAPDVEITGCGGVEKLLANCRRYGLQKLEQHAVNT